MCVMYASVLALFYHLSFYPGGYSVALSDTACPHRDVVFLENHNMCRNSTIFKKIFETSKSTLQPRWFAWPSLLQVEQVRLDTYRTSRLHKYLISIVALQCSWHSPIHIHMHTLNYIFVALVNDLDLFYNVKYHVVLQLYGVDFYLMFHKSLEWMVMPEPCSRCTAL